MIDPIEFRVSGRAPVHILRDAWHSNPLRVGSLAFRIAPPISRLSNGLAHAKSCAILNGLQDVRESATTVVTCIIDMSRCILLVRRTQLPTHRLRQVSVWKAGRFARSRRKVAAPLPR